MTLTSQTIIIAIVICYLGITSMIGFLQSKKLENGKSFGINKIGSFQAATFLLGFTLGGTTTYGVASDTIKFGLTYLVWFPISVVIGSWFTGFMFAKSYYKMQGVTLPALLGQRFDQKTRYVAAISNLIYIIFVFILEIFTLSVLMGAILPNLSMFYTVLFSFLTCITSVAFSGILGASKVNLLHSLTMVITFLIVFLILYKAVGGYENALRKISTMMSLINLDGLPFSKWITPFGLGWGVIGQILLAKSGRLGGISAVSNLAASCKGEKEAIKAFIYAGILSGVISFFSCSVGVFTAAYLGSKITEMPIYSAIGVAVSDFNPLLAGCFFAALAAAIVSTFGPSAISLSTIIVDDILERMFNLSISVKKYLYTFSVFFVSLLCSLYVLKFDIKHLMPFVFSTAFPTTIPTTIVALFGIKTQKTTPSAAFWAILLGVTISLTWGLLLKNPFGIPNIYLALMIPLCILGIDYFYGWDKPIPRSTSTTNYFNLD